MTIVMVCRRHFPCLFYAKRGGPNQKLIHFQHIDITKSNRHAHHLLFRRYLDGHISWPLISAHFMAGDCSIDSCLYDRAYDGRSVNRAIIFCGIYLYYFASMAPLLRTTHAPECRLQSYYAVWPTKCAFIRYVMPLSLTMCIILLLRYRR